MTLVAAPHATAQQAPVSTAGPEDRPEDRLVYPASYYAQFEPRTARDMIERTPGFSLIEPSERRGFSGAVGNILVDGERPIAKSQSLSDILQRIPASQVVRVELLRGGAGDASGQGLVANVVRTPSAGQGVWQLGAEHAGRTPVPNGWASWSGRIGKVDYSLGANGYNLMRHLPGDREVRDGGGNLISTLEDRSPRTFAEIAVNGEASRAMFGGITRLTGQFAYSRYADDASVVTFSPAGLRTEEEANPYWETKRTIEGGLSHERPLGGWDLSLSVLLTRTRYESAITSTHRGDSGSVDSVFTQDIARDSGETILRATLARDFSSAHRVEAGLEGAINTLEQRLLRTLDLGRGAFPLPIPNSNLAVKEHRGDAYLIHRWTPDRRWTVETRLAAEASRLSFTGDTEQAVTLAFLKPSLLVTRSIGSNDQVRLRVYRDVGQLDFADFVSTASLSDDIIRGGNPDLRPETSWRIEATADLRFGKQGAATLTLFRHWLSDAIDLVPVGPVEDPFDAPGNIGSGDVWGAQAVLRLPLAPVIAGGSFTLDGTWRESRITDPVTGERRRASNFEAVALKAEFRHDVPRRKFAWGIAYKAKPERVAYRLDEIDRRRESPTLDLFAETTALKGFKLGATLASLLGTPERRTRTFFAPDRNGPVTRVEQSARYPGRWLILTVSGSF
ncbi:TonB-dependent receptor [Sphingomonas sp. BT-65]|uniref:TonB-dependent receptor plug domain-containing protein n=1 Tax=Sphingomonas sp. BT-65 TaxID=2989821 RepID=UPI0022359439|nr:TonB-dependent receptor [Sphingomonas sp. BT-65]MCW4460238.1 TonB-dependent receptor [Sphingomonas sp. BT-65]